MEEKRKERGDMKKEKTEEAPVTIYELENNHTVSIASQLTRITISNCRKFTVSSYSL